MRACKLGPGRKRKTGKCQIITQARRGRVLQTCVFEVVRVRRGNCSAVVLPGASEACALPSHDDARKHGGQNGFQKDRHGGKKQSSTRLCNGRAKQGNYFRPSSREKSEDNTPSRGNFCYKNTYTTVFLALVLALIFPEASGKKVNHRTGQHRAKCAGSAGAAVVVCVGAWPWPRFFCAGSLRWKVTGE